jgi:hypothetical protein
MSMWQDDTYTRAPPPLQPASPRLASSQRARSAVCRMSLKPRLHFVTHDWTKFERSRGKLKHFALEENEYEICSVVSKIFVSPPILVCFLHLGLYKRGRSSREHIPQPPLLMRKALGSRTLAAIFPIQSPDMRAGWDIKPTDPFSCDLVWERGDKIFGKTWVASGGKVLQD